MDITIHNINEELVKITSLYGKTVATKWFKQRLVELSTDMSTDQNDRDIATAALKYFIEFTETGNND